MLEPKITTGMRFTAQTHKRLKRMAFDQETTMTQLLEDIINMIWEEDYGSDTERTEKEPVQQENTS